eukprot:1157857-Pelagomonas_calceolata.AAC.2
MQPSSGRQGQLIGQVEDGVPDAVHVCAAGGATATSTTPAHPASLHGSLGEPCQPPYQGCQYGFCLAKLIRVSCQTVQGVSMGSVLPD